MSSFTLIRFLLHGENTVVAFGWLLSPAVFCFCFLVFFHQCAIMHFVRARFLFFSFFVFFATCANNSFFFVVVRIIIILCHWNSAIIGGIPRKSDLVGHQ
jgi:hypothetical protein